MNSMTAYAQGRFSFDHFTYFFSIKSLNHRYLELGFKGSGMNAEIEKIVKQVIKGRLHRGKVEVTFNLFEYDPGNWDIQLNEPLLEAIIDKFATFQARHPGLQLTLDSFLRIPMIFHLESVSERLSEAVMEQISCGITEVFDRFLACRQEEGELTAVDIFRSLDLMVGLIDHVGNMARDVEENLLQRYRERIKNLMGETVLDERRLAQEAAIAADRSCISEELSRLSSHRERLTQICREGGDFIGREADFLAQEMLRETHTIASKTSSLEVHGTVLQIRRLIEKIKQQVQNVE